MKTRKIIVRSKASDKAEIQKRYSVDDYSEDSVVTYEVIIEDTSENLKKLCQDRKIIDWSDSTPTTTSVARENRKEDSVFSVNPGLNMKEVASVDLVVEGIKRNLKTLDTHEMKTIIRRLMALKDALEYRKGSGMAPETIVAESFGMPWDQEDPVFSEGSVKLMLRRMAADRKIDFDAKFLDAMIGVAHEVTENPELLEYLTPEAMIRKIFEEKWKETN